MIVGVPQEVKPSEYRVALVPAGAEALVSAGHQVLVERGAGAGSGFEDRAYAAVGATVGLGAEEVWRYAGLILKVKEPVEAEWPRMRAGQAIFTYFHFAASEALTRAALTSGAVALAYETVQLPTGELPLLTPMSEVAGRMAPQEGAKYLEGSSAGAGSSWAGCRGWSPRRC